MHITNPYGPNTTILLPGSCNAFCDFCFWNRDNAKIKPEGDYVENVLSVIKNLPEEFSVLSISGGEPTLSPYFQKFLSKLSVFRRTHYLDRVVLTTHGGNLLNNIALVGSAVDHINISRHGIGEEENYRIFNTHKIPSDTQLVEIIQRTHLDTLCDVTFNCVVNEDVTVKWCEEFIKYAKSLGADAVSFRKEASDVSPTQAEEYFVARYGVDNETKCPVCRGLTQRVDGFQVRWKGSVLEPSIATNGVYEVVIHPDGKPYTDWNMKVPFKHTQDNKEAYVEVNMDKLYPDIKSHPVYLQFKNYKSTGASSKYSSRSSGGCGSGGCGRR